MALRGRGRFALAAAIAGLVVWASAVGATTSRLVDAGFAVTSLTLGLVALILGALDWRSNSGKAALGIVLGFVALAALVLLTFRPS